MTTNFKKIGTVKFPGYTGININMMPFIMGDNSTIPEEYRVYASLIDSCPVHESEIGKVGYLSVNESCVDKNKSQRRPGIHTEKHPGVGWGGGGTGWGGRVGGLFLASTVDDSCAVWDLHIDEPGAMGDCEHLRKELGEPTLMKQNELFWLTDGTPHEALLMSNAAKRQWFRLVTSEVGLWYSKHSTQNRLGVTAPCRIVDTDKFAKIPM